MNEPANRLEEGAELLLDFDKISRVADRCPGIVPVAVQNVDSMEVILVAYSNREALEHSLRTRAAAFWSTSRDELWIKGAESGNTFELIEVRVNCEQNSLLYLVRPQSQGICHTKNSTGQARDCYYRRLDLDSLRLENLDP